MDVISITRIFNVTLTGIAILGWIYFYIRTKEPIAFAPLSWLVSLFAFYVYRFYTLTFSSAIKNTEFLNLWSSLLHTHALLLLCVSVFLVCTTLKSRKKFEDIIEKIKEEREQCP